MAAIALGPRPSTTYRGHFTIEFERLEFAPCDSDSTWWVDHESSYRAGQAFRSSSPEEQERLQSTGSARVFVKWRARRSAFGSHGHFGMWPYKITVSEILELRPESSEDCQS